MGDIPECELSTILKFRCACPPSHATLLVKLLPTLRNRRNKSLIFCGQDGFVTPRDLLRWSNRGGSTKVDLAREGCMLLVERLHDEDEKKVV